LRAFDHDGRLRTRYDTAAQRAEPTAVDGLSAQSAGRERPAGPVSAGATHRITRKGELR
jgi:hypothetical protein